MSPWRRRAALAVSALVVGGLVGCGSDADPTPSGQSGQAGDALAGLVNDVKVSLQKAVDTTDSAKSVSFTMTGTIGGEKQTSEGAVVLSDPPRLEMTATDAAGDKQVIRMIGSAIYTEVPEAERAGMDGKKWLKMDLGKAGAGDAMTRNLDELDPVKQVKTLLAGGDIKVVGQETVDGVQTVHYTTTQPVTKYLENVDAELREGVRKSMAEAGIETVTTDLWVDDQYRPRQVRVQMGAGGDLTVNYHDYDKDVTIEEPPASETADFNDLLGDLGDLQKELGE